MIFLKFTKMTHTAEVRGQRSKFDLIWPKNSHFGSIDTVRRYRFEPKICFLVLIISRSKHFLKIRKVDLYGWSQRSIFVLIWPRNSHFGFIYIYSHMIPVWTKNGKRSLLGLENNIYIIVAIGPFWKKLHFQNRPQHLM